MYFPFAVKHDPGHPKAEEAICRLEKRMQWLNQCHILSGIEGHIFAEAICAYAKRIPSSTVSASSHPTVWEFLMHQFQEQQIADLVIALAPQFADTLPRLEFPNAVALVDCRFVTTKEWEFLRRYSVGGSEVAVLVGKAHYGSPLKLYHDKRGEIPDLLDIDKEFIFGYGHCVEDHVVEKTCSLLGAIHYPEHRMFHHKDYSFITANPDAILMFPDGSLALFEAKTATRHKKDDWQDGIPEYYAPQPQQYLAVLNDPRLKKGYIGAVFGGLPSDFKAHLYEKNDAMAEEQIRAICHFWYNHIQKEVPPPLIGSAEKDIEAIYCTKQTGTGSGTLSLPAYTADEFGIYFDLKESRSIIDKKVKELKEEGEKLLRSILELCPLEETTICTRSDGSGLSYRLRRFKKNDEWVDTVQLPPQILDMLQLEAARIASPSLGFTNPKLKKVGVTK